MMIEISVFSCRELRSQGEPVLLLTSTSSLPPPVVFCLTLPAQPILFTSQLADLETEAGQTAVLRCETTKPGAGVIWRHGDLVLEPDSRHQLRREGTVAELLIHKLQREDSGEYTCDTGSHRTCAILTVLGRRV